MSDLTIEQKRTRVQIYWSERKQNKMTLKQIAEKVGVSIMTVRRWKDKTTNLPHKRIKRRNKFNQTVKRYIYKLAANKFTGIEHASSRKIMFKVKRKFKTDISHSTVNNYLRQMLKKPRRAHKTFIVSSDYKEQRLKFAKYIKENYIKGEEIFFTDEKRFY